MDCGISVIIPVYNGEKYIKKCVESVINQTHQNIEIIILNDGSTDSTGFICTGLQEKDSRIRIVNKRNSGLGDTRNLGIQISINKYITFLDADDWLERNFIEEMIKAMREKDAKIAICDIHYYDNATGHKAISKLRISSPISDVSEDLSIINKARTFAWGKLYDKSLFHGDVLYPNWTFEDIPCTPVLIFQAKKIAYVPQALYNYRRNQINSLSCDVNNIDDIAKSLNLLCQRVQNIGAEQRLADEVKKIMLGQLRFALSRWGKNENLSVKASLQKINRFVDVYYRCAKKFEDILFMIEEDALLRKALLCIVVNKEQIIKEAEKADYCIRYRKSNELESNQWIEISPEYQMWNNEEMAKWEIAEKVMEKM